MKKISAILISLIMTCGVFASCGNDDSDSEENNTSSEASDSAAREVRLAEVYTANINRGEFTIDMTINAPMVGEMPCVVWAKDGNYYSQANSMGLNAEVYIVDGTGYMIIPDAGIYYDMVEMGIMDLEDMGVNTLALDASCEYVETREEDGMTVEVYNATYTDDYELEIDDSADTPQDSQTEDSEEDYTFVMTIAYYFDDNDRLVKAVTSDELTGETTVTINSLEWTCEDIVLPDLAGLTEMTEDTQLTEEQQLRLNLAALGVTEEMLTEAGYTYEDILALSDEEAMTVLADLGVDISALTGGLE